MNSKFKRVLVLSHNSFSKTQNNGKTLESFFANWDKDCIAQLYLQPDDPDFDFCSNYYRMTDYEILNNVFFSGRVGQELMKDYKEQETREFNRSVKKLYDDRRNGNERGGLNKYIHEQFVAKKPIFVASRDLFWSLGKWKNDKLISWILKFNPDVLFFQGSNSVFGYKIALWICEKFEIPLVLELTDDYTYSMYRYSLIEKINKMRYLKFFRKAIQESMKVITISKYMEDEYKQRFGGNYTVMLNSVKESCFGDVPNNCDSIRMLYAGNISINRWKVLCEIGKALQIINKEMHINSRLDIFTPTGTSRNIIENLIAIETINYCGSLSSEELLNEIENSNYLVHVESFDEKMKKITRLSVSTKIPEYLSSNRCIYAVGPSEIASIRYLADNGAAHITTNLSVKSITLDLKGLFCNNDLRNSYLKNAKTLFTNNHRIEENQENIFLIINEVVEKGKNNDEK